MAIRVKTVVEYTVIAVILFFAGAWFFTQLFPYFEHVEMARTRIRQAERYLSTEICTKPDVRSELEGYNQCESSKILAAQNPYMIGLYDTAAKAQLCSDDACTFMGFNLTNILGRIAVIAVITLFLGVFCCFSRGIKMQSDREERFYQLPYVQDMSKYKKA